MNVKDSIKKVGAVAASTLMVGMTMGAAQSLSEFPGMFVDDEGSPTAQVVVGSQGAVSDVVGAVNVAAALGQATIQTEEMTEEVDVETSGGAVGWSADAGTTLDTSNDQLRFADQISDVRSTLTEDDLDALGTTTFQDDDGDSQEVEHYLYLGDQPIDYGQLGDQDDADPGLHVHNPADVDATTDGADYLYRLQANFGDGLTMTGADDDPVLGEEIDLFGKSFTISEDSFSGDHDGELVLFGSSEEYDLETGESTEFEVDGETHTLEVRAVTSSDTAAFFLDGELQERDEGNTFNVDGTDVRVDSVIQTSTDNSEGLVTFSIGSEEYVMSHGNAVEDADGDEIEGTDVVFSGSDNVDDADLVDDGDEVTIDSLEVGVGADDGDNNYVPVDEAFQDPLFEGVNFHFGGLAPDVAEGGDGVAEVDFSTDDELATVDFADGDDSASVDFFDATDEGQLQTEDGDIVVVEGEEVNEDDYFVADPGDFDRMWEVTSIDRDTDTPSDGEDEATVELTDAVSGQDVEAVLDDVDNAHYRGEEVIDGQTYHFRVDEGTDNLEVTWGPDSGFGDVGDDLSVYSAVDMEGDAALAFTEEVTFGTAFDALADVDASEDDQHVLDLVMPSTETTGTQAAAVTVDTDADSEATAVTIGDQEFTPGSGDVTGYQDVTVGQVDYEVDVNFVENTDSDAFDTVEIEGVRLNAAEAHDASALVLEPEDDSDEEHGYHVMPDSNDDDEAEINSDSEVVYTGDDTIADLSHALEESDEDTEAWYDVYGTYGMLNTEDEGSLTLHVPGQQAAAGAAFYGSGGDLSMSGSSGSGTGEVTYTGVTNEDIRGALPDMAKTDDQVTSSDRQNSHLILVGGPAVNTLVADLADDGDTWTAEQWRNEHVDEALLQVVEDAFADGQHAMIVAGHSADDTRAAARYISEWRSHQDTLEEAGMQYSPSSQEAPR